MNKTNNERIEEMMEIANKIKNSGVILDDIRDRDWLKKDSTVSQILKKLIEIENLLMSLDEYNTNNDLDYDYIEDFMLQIGKIREAFTNYIDNNTDLTNIKTK